jgi:hypothetical protein
MINIDIVGDLKEELDEVLNKNDYSLSIKLPNLKISKRFSLYILPLKRNFAGNHILKKRQKSYLSM